MFRLRTPIFERAAPNMELTFIDTRRLLPKVKSIHHSSGAHNSIVRKSASLPLPKIHPGQRERQMEQSIRAWKLISALPAVQFYIEGNRLSPELEMNCWNDEQINFII